LKGRILVKIRMWSHNSNPRVCRLGGTKTVYGYSNQRLVTRGTKTVIE
jgi:hypothetical protein